VSLLEFVEFVDEDLLPDLQPSTAKIARMVARASADFGDCIESEPFRGCSKIELDKST
jgi:hypothetical protein